MNPSKQTGLVVVETAIVGLLAMVTLFAVLEVARVFFVMNALEEAARRGARVAAVCQVNDPAISQIAIFNNSGDGGGSTLIHDLSTAHVDLAYLDGGGGVVGDPVGSFFNIRYVRVGIVGYQHQLLIPLFFTTLTLPRFDATLPRESLGVSREGFTVC